METTQLEEIINKVTEIGAPFLVNLFAAIVIYVVGKWAAKMISGAIYKGLVKAETDEALARFARNLAYAAILIFAIVAAIGKLGVQTTSFIAILGAAGLAIGMALQGTLSNFAAGVMIILFRPFRIGDFVEAAGTMGVVKEIQIFNTVLSSPDNKKIILPNSKVSGEKVVNYSATENRRVDMIFGISYGDDIKKAKEILSGILESDSRILKEPAPVIAVSELGDNSVNLVCRPWVKPEDYWNVYFDVLEKGKTQLEEGGCSIPFPQRDVHLYQESK